MTHIMAKDLTPLNTLSLESGFLLKYLEVYCIENIERIFFFLWEDQVEYNKRPKAIINVITIR